jgi:hypothetical protein
MFQTHKHNYYDDTLLMVPWFMAPHGIQEQRSRVLAALASVQGAGRRYLAGGALRRAWRGQSLDCDWDIFGAGALRFKPLVTPVLGATPRALVDDPQFMDRGLEVNLIVGPHAESLETLFASVDFTCNQVAATAGYVAYTAAAKAALEAGELRYIPHGPGAVTRERAERLCKDEGFTDCTDGYSRARTPAFSWAGGYGNG